jgi:TfoX/Sxy family transcriptional regulator of competence genes
MAYDEGLGQRIREVLDEQPNLVEKKMFGGVGFMVQGNMACGVHKDMLIVRVGPDAYEETMQYPHTRPFDMTGRAMKGWVMVEPGGFESDEDLKDWVKQGLNFALTLPPK